MQVSTVFGKPLPKRNAESVGDSRRFRILVLGDFGSEASWGPPRAVDRDNLEDVFKQMNVRLRVRCAENAPELDIALGELDDFHPDRLFDQLDLFASLRTRRRRLQNDQTFAQESAAILAARGEPDAVDALAADSEGKSNPKPNADSETAGEMEPADLLSQALEQTEQNQKPVVQQISEGSLNIDDYVRRVVEPSVINKADPRKPEFIDGVDEAIAAAMRQLLHHPSFQKVEAAWRGVQMLIRRLETDSTLQIHMVNVSKEQLAADVSARDDLSTTELHKLLVEAASDPWTVVLGDFVFDGNLDDTKLLGRIAKVHSAAGAVFVAGASPSIVGCPDLIAAPDPEDWDAASTDASAQWQELRNLSDSAHVALTMPRILARRPYGKKSDPIDSFRFDEISSAEGGAGNEGSDHYDYLWMNAAFGVGVLLGSSFSVGGWSLASAWSNELDDLPVHVYTDDDGESVLKPCGETELSLGAVDAFTQAGLTVVRSVRGKGAVQIPWLRTLSLSHEPFKIE